MPTRSTIKTALSVFATQTGSAVTVTTQPSADVVQTGSISFRNPK